MIARLLIDLRQRGVEFRLDGDTVRWRAPVGTVRPGEKEELRAHRDEIFALIDRIEERAAIREYDAGEPRAMAEAAAWHELAILAADTWRGAA